MGHISVLLLVSLAGLFLVYGYPIKSTPVTYPHGDAGTYNSEWSNGQVIFLAVSALALICTAAALLFGCTWCYRHKDCKQNEGPEHQLFTTSATHLADSATRRPQPPDTDNANNNISEDNNNGPISLREMQNIANNNATAYIVSENEERNRTASRESVVQFEPLPAGIGGVNDPLAPHAAWFVEPRNHVNRDRLQYLREMDRGWFGRIVEGEIESDEHDGQNTSVAVKILDQNSTPTNKARFLTEGRLFRNVTHENILPLINYSLEEEPWIMMFEFCSMDLQQYLITNRPKMAILNESGVTLRLKCDIAAGLTYLHAQNLLFGDVWSGNISIRGSLEHARALLGRPSCVPPPALYVLQEPHTSKLEVYSLGIVLWEICSWGTLPPRLPPAAPALPCPYRSHLYQVMQLCWSTELEARPTASQVYDLLNHLLISHQQSNDISSEESTTDFEDRWQRLKPNTIPKVDEHVAIIHAPSISNTSQFTGSEDLENNQPSMNDTLSISLNAASRSSSLMSDKDPLSTQIKSDSLTNLHGSFEDVRNIYLNHSEQTIMECQQENMQDLDSSDSSDLRVDPWLKDIIAGSQDDVSYYRDVSDVIKNLDNILNSEKTSSSDSSHQASPSRDNLTLDCKKDYPIQSCLVKSPGITNFQNILNMTPEHKPKQSDEEEADREKIEPLNHSFERYSDTNSQNTLENITPDTPNIDFKCFAEDPIVENMDNFETNANECEVEESKISTIIPVETSLDNKNIEVGKIYSEEEIPLLKDLCLATVNLNIISVSKLEESIKCESTVNEKKLQDTAETIQDKINEGKTISINLEDQAEIENKENSPKPLTISEVSDNSTVYMDLINDTGSELINKNINLDLNVKDIVETFSISNSGFESSKIVNESTIYLDLPAVIKETDNLLNSERLFSDQDSNANDRIITTSTPKESDVSSIDDNFETSKLLKEHSSVIEEPNYGPGITVTKLEQKAASDIFSPFDSPTKSHPTDTFDENSSVVLGPFENCTLDLFKGVKTSITPTNELLDVPKDELLTFSLNDIVLETPSPLRDRNFLNEVPDIDAPESTKSSSPVKPSNIDIKSTMESLDLPPLSPTTPPNSPGNFLLASPQHKYVIENVGDPLHDDLPDPILDLDDDLNQIELQISSKIAMAENENNMNLEYSGPLNIEQIETFPDIIENGGGRELLVGGNGEYFGGDNGEREILADSMQALRDELELKLPLAQSVNIEPPAENDGWSGEFPMPPEMILNYAGALSPIMEETGHQLSAYENDRPWVSIRTESSESYPEPCTADDVTELVTGARGDTYTLQSDHNTYTVQKDDASSKLITMSADSLNATPLNNEPISKLPNDSQPKKDDNIEIISQVSPFILSPTTESIPENESGISALTKTSIPTDAKSSKPSETQCLSKATSIDSWCSNDTLFNVEDNFDDLAMDPDLPSSFKVEDDHSQSTETLTHHDDEDKECSHCSTYIVHDSKSDSCANTMPDTSSGHRTYNIPKEETDDKNSPSIITKSEINDSSTKNTQTKDLAYGTLQSGTSQLATYSNCTTEALSEPWKCYPPPEMVRRSPVNEVLGLSPPQNNYEQKYDSPEELPNVSSKKQLKKMDSFDIECLTDHSMEKVEAKDWSPQNVPAVSISNVTDENFEHLALYAESTPILEIVDNDSGETITLELPQDSDASNTISTIPNFVTFFQSVELRPQDISSNESINATSTNTDLLLEGESQTMSCTQTDSYTVFQDSVVTKPQEVHPAVSSQYLNSDMNFVQDFNQFESSVRSRPQDLSDIESTSLLLQNEILSSESQLLPVFDIPPNVTTKSSPIGEANKVVVYENSLNNEIFRQESQTQNNLEVKDISNNSSEFKETDNISNTSVLNINNIDTFNSHNDEFSTFDSHAGQNKLLQGDNTIESNFADPKSPVCNGDVEVIINKSETPKASSLKSEDFPEIDDKNPEYNKTLVTEINTNLNKIPNGTLEDNVKNENFATENFLSEAFEELVESNVDDVNVSQESSENIEPSPIKTEVTNNEAIINKSLNNEECNAVYDKECTAKNDEELTATNDEKHIALNNEEFYAVNDEEVNAANHEEYNTKKHEYNNEGNGEEFNEEYDVENDEEFNPGNDEEYNAENDEEYNAENDEEYNEVNNVEYTAVNNDRRPSLTTATADFIVKEKLYCQLDKYLPLLSDIRFTGPADDCMSTSFTHLSPTEETHNSVVQERRTKSLSNAADLVKEWDSDSDDSASSNSSSGEFIWKQGANGSPTRGAQPPNPSSSFGPHSGSGVPRSGNSGSHSGNSGSGDSGSGSDGDELEFVPSSWDCRAEPSKSSLRTAEQAQTENKKRVVFKRQKYHCVYEYPREAPHIAPDYSTYTEWDAASAEEAELGYGQLFGSHPLDLFSIPAGVSFGGDYEEDFFISSSARPFESLGLLPPSSQFFPGKQSPHSPHPILPHDLPRTTPHTLDFTTPDSGVEDITPGSLTEDLKKIPTDLTCWKSLDSGSSSESVSPSSPASESLGGLRHTRDKLKLDLPPSPHLPSPRHNKVFNFSLDKPKPRRMSTEEKPTPVVMTDETPIINADLIPLETSENVVLPEPTFSTFGKDNSKSTDTDKPIIFSDIENSVEDDKEPNSEENKVDTVSEKKEGTDSGDEDSGIESSSKATLERINSATKIT